MDTVTAEKLLQMTQEGYALIAEQFDKTRNHSWDDFSVFDCFVKEGMRILDVGCGNGRLLDYLSQRRNITYVGIDQNQKFVEIAKKKFGNSRLDSPKFYSANILQPESLSTIDDQQFDLIFCIAVLHHIPTKELRLQALQTLKKYLKRGGVLCMENWNMWQFRKGAKNIWKSPRRAGIRDLITEWKSSRARGFLYYYAFTISELRALLRKSEFGVLQAFYIRDGKSAHWWNGKNIITIARNSIL